MKTVSHPGYYILKNNHEFMKQFNLSLDSSEHQK